MRETFEKNNVEFKDSMFQQNLSTKAYIYFRHNFSQETLAYDRPPNTQRTKLTTADITKKQLEEEFGFFHELKSIEWFGKKYLSIASVDSIMRENFQPL